MQNGNISSLMYNVNLHFYIFNSIKSITSLIKVQLIEGITSKDY